MPKQRAATQVQAQELARLDLPITQRGLEQYAAHPDDIIGKASTSKATVVKIPISMIVESGDNARRSFDQTELEGLAQNIRAVGLRDAVEVKPRGNVCVTCDGVYRFSGDGNTTNCCAAPVPSKTLVKYELVDGARRLRAFQLLYKTDPDAYGEIPCFVRDDNDLTTAVVRAAKNHQRVQLTPYEEALDFRNIIKQGATIEQCAQLVGKSEAVVKSRMRLLDLPEDVARKLGHDGFTLQHAEFLLQFVPYPKAFNIAKSRLGKKDYEGKALSPNDLRREVRTELSRKNMIANNYAYEDVRQVAVFKEVWNSLPKLNLNTHGRDDLVVLDVDGKLVKAAQEARAAKVEREQSKRGKAAAKSRKDPAAAKARELKKARRDRDARDRALRERVGKIEGELVGKYVAKVTTVGGRELRLIGHALMVRTHLHGEELDMLSAETEIPSKDLRAALSSHAKRDDLLKKLIGKKDQRPLARLLAGFALQNVQDHLFGKDLASLIENLTGVKAADITKRAQKELADERAAAKTTTKKSPKKSAKPPAEATTDDDAEDRDANFDDQEDE